MDHLWDKLERSLLARFEALKSSDRSSVQEYVRQCAEVRKAQEAIKARILEDASITGF